MNPEPDDQEIVDKELPLYMIFVCEQGNLSLIRNMNRIIYREKETIKKDWEIIETHNPFYPKTH